MDFKQLVVFFAAILNVFLILQLPINYIGNEIPVDVNLSERHKLIVERGWGTAEDYQYIEEQNILIYDSVIKEADQSLYVPQLTTVHTKSIVYISVVSSIILLVLAYFNFLNRLISLVFFSIGSMLVLLIAPMASSGLFLIIIANLLIIFFLNKAVSLKLRKL